MVTFRNTVSTGLCPSGPNEDPHCFNRNTIGQNSNIFFSETAGPISMKFHVNDVWVVPFHNIVFYGFMSLRPLMRTRTVLHRNTTGKNSNISETMGLISIKFCVHDLSVCPFIILLFYRFMSIKPLMRTRTVYIEILKGK